MKKPFLLRLCSNDRVKLRTIDDRDSENLRRWKNANRFAFFFQDSITPEMQSEWYRAYADRANDYLFMVLHNDIAVGCMGFRLLGMKADIYNVILGQSQWRGTGLMSQALTLMCSYIFSDFTHEIGLKVLRSNPAAAWYCKNGFREDLVHDTYLELKLDPTRFKSVKFQKLEVRSERDKPQFSTKG